MHDNPGYRAWPGVSGFTDQKPSATSSVLTAPSHRRELQVHCYRTLATFEDARDMTQETFLRAWHKRASFQGHAALRTWLYRIATNACLDFLDKRNDRTPVPSGLPGVGSEVAGSSTVRAPPAGLSRKKSAPESCGTPGQGRTPARTAGVSTDAGTLPPRVGHEQVVLVRARQIRIDHRAVRAVHELARPHRRDSRARRRSARLSAPSRRTAARDDGCPVVSWPCKY